MRPGWTILLCGLTVLLVLGCQSDIEIEREVPTVKSYPTTQRQAVTDDYFGTAVADPYRWLENEDSPETSAWIDAQNDVTLPFLKALPARQRIIDRLTKLWNYERFGTPVKRAGRYFFSRNDGLQNQSVLYVADGLDRTPRVLIDPNGFSDDGTLALSDWSVSPDGLLIAYAVSDGGSDWRTWHIMVIATGVELPDRVGHTKFSGVSWAKDAGSFVYSRYPLSADGKADDQKPVTVYRHRVGTDQSMDEEVFRLDHATRNPYATLTDDGRFMILNVWDGYLSNGVYYRDLRDPAAPVVRLLDAWDARYLFLGNDGSRLFFETTLDAPRRRVISIDVNRPAREAWGELVPERAEVMESSSLVGRRIVCSYLKDARSLVRIYGLTGAQEREVRLPGIGTSTGFGGRIEDPETFYSFTSFNTPEAVYRYDVATGESTLFRRPKVDFDPDAFEARQEFYESKDGTRVPMFIVHKKGLELDGDRPCMLYGYGGFDVSLTPAFGPSLIAWMEMGGVYAVPNLRGGGEYGEAWHVAGTKLTKQNVFDDFIAAAEWLIAHRYTRAERLAIRGGSNGGLLVGACMTQRPELFAACLPAVGVLDMLRYHLQSANARQWSSDYGLSENEGEFRALYAYSPLHNLKPGTSYPATLITTGKGDDRVAPWHSYKFAAALQASQGGKKPVLIRVETRAGHGAGKPTWMRIEEIADEWAFLHYFLGMAP